jgi:hypothetical protein
LIRKGVSKRERRVFRKEEGYREKRERLVLKYRETELVEKGF